jgi:hypothetical protein
MKSVDATRIERIERPKVNWLPNKLQKMPEDDLSRQLRSEYFKVVKKSITATSADFSGNSTIAEKQIFQPIIDKWWDNKKIQTISNRRSLQGLKNYLRTQPKA